MKTIQISPSSKTGISLELVRSHEYEHKDANTAKKALSGFINSAYNGRLFELIKKFENGEENKKPFDFVKFNKKIKESGKENGAGPLETFDNIPNLPSSLCSKCDHAKTCPFFIKDQVCYYLGQVFLSDRDQTKFSNKLIACTDRFIKGSTLFTVCRTSADIDFAVFLAWLQLKLFSDSELPDKRFKSEKTTGVKTELGRKITKTKETEAILKKQEAIKDRWQILRLPGSPTDERYYPKI